MEMECEFPLVGHRTMLANARLLPFNGAERILLVLTDITEQKHIEAALLEADRRKNEFLATLAHELRNPLAPIQNVVQLMQSGTPSDSDVSWGRDVIDRQVKHLVRLVDDLMDMSRITQGKIDLQFERTSISEVIACAVETSRPLIDARNHEFTITVPHRPLFVNGDLVRLAQVLSNLLNNSAKYTASRGKISLVVEAHGGEVIVRVEDNGVGIASDMLSSIFEMFMQAKNATELAQGGLGIGLTLAQRLTQLHGGSLEVASDGLDKGSVFTLRLPLYADTISYLDPSTKDSRDTAASALHRKILVADDNHDAADTLAMLLRSAGHSVCVANDGLEAVEKAESNRPDVAFLDIGMPNLNGYEAARRIRAQSWGKAITLVALTGWGQNEDRQRSVEAGFSHHLVKPINYSTLATLLSM
jgi:CheY-like chemotaxis protein